MNRPVSGRRRSAGPRLFIAGPLALGNRLTLDHEARIRLTRVLRLEPGAVFTLFDGSGDEYPSRLEDRRGTVQVLDRISTKEASPLAITLVQGLCSGDRMDWVVQKATELGVMRIMPVLSAYSTARANPHHAASRLDHLRKVAIAACEQSGRNHLPLIEQPRHLASWLDALPPATEASRLLFTPGGRHALRTLPRPHDLVLLIGPEGGLAPEEEHYAQQCGFLDVGLGPRMLRTETAAIAAVSACQVLWGDLGPIGTDPGAVP
jgi:16S rRNA (uracil1498-N3)-methyltransferase